MATNLHTNYELYSLFHALLNSRNNWFFFCSVKVSNNFQWDIWFEIIFWKLTVEILIFELYWLKVESLLKNFFNMNCSERRTGSNWAVDLDFYRLFQTLPELVFQERKSTEVNLKQDFHCLILTKSNRTVLN